MIYTRKQVDYWRVDYYRLRYIYSDWSGPSIDRSRLPGCTANIYEDSLYLHNDQLFLQVL